MDVKSEVEIKDELLESSEDVRNDGQNFEQDSGLQDIQNYILCTNINQEEEIEINNDPLNITEEHSENDQFVEQILGLESPSLIEDVEEEEGGRIEATSSLNNRPQTSRKSKENLETKEMKNLNCTFSDPSFKSKDELKSHLRSHKKFKCDQCSYESNYKGCLKVHLLKHSNTKLFKCTECSHEFNRKVHLNRHMLRHANFKLFKCSLCSYEFNRKEHLKRHMLKHDNFELFKCSECSYDCCRKCDLQLHMETHANIEFKCSECSYIYKRKAHLKRHMLTHANFKLFKCSECSYECNRKEHLKRHILTHAKKTQVSLTLSV